MAIIGAGFTGLSAAHHLLQSGMSTAVLDAHEIGFGASGRTGAMAVPRYKRGFAMLAKMYGTETAIRLHGLILEAVDTLEELVRAYDLDCQFGRYGHITAAHGRAAMRALEDDAEWLAIEAGDRSPVLLDAHQMADRTGTRIYVGGYLDPRGAGIHPLDFVRGLSAGLARRGVHVHPNTPVTRIIQSATGEFQLVTPTGVVHATRVVIATNAYSNLFPVSYDLPRRIVPVASSVIATAPLSRDRIAEILPFRNLLTDTRKLTNYFRVIEGNRLVFGGRGDLLGRDSPGSFSGLEDLLVETFPQLRDVTVTHRWSGKVAVTLDDFPHLGTVRPGICFALGCGGRGVALTQLLGKFVARLVRGEQVEAGPMSGASFRPIPFHFMRVPAMQTIASYYRWQDLRNAKASR